MPYSLQRQGPAPRLRADRPAQAARDGRHGNTSRDHGAGSGRSGLGRPGVIRERLLSYDPAARSWSDQADRLPWYITRGRCRQSAGHHEQFHLVAHLPGPVGTGAYATKPPQRALTTVAGMRPSARGEDASQPPARRPADVPPAAAGSVAGPQCARHAAAELGAVVSPELARNG